MALTIPEEAYIVSMLAPAADAGGRTSGYLSLKNALKAWIVCHINQGNAATIALTPAQATAVAGTGTKAITATNIWTNLDMAAANQYTKQTAAASYTTDAGVKVKVVVFELNPTYCMDVAGGFDCVAITTGASNAANITSAFLLVQPKHVSPVQMDVLAD